MPSHPSCDHAIKEFCDVCSVVIDISTRKPSDLCAKQLNDEELKKIIQNFEDTEKGVDYTNWIKCG